MLLPRTVLLVVIAISTACGGADGDDRGDVARPPTSARAAHTGPPTRASMPSWGCDRDATTAIPTGRSTVTIPSSGDDRAFLRDVPSAHDGTRPVPVVLDFHGASEGAAIHVQATALSTTGERHGFVTITPEAQGPYRAWDPTLGSSDLVFVGDLLDEVERTLCIDTASVYATGYSLGAAMATAVGCDLADRVAAVAPVAGVREIEGCDPDRPVPVVAFHGTADDFVTYDGRIGEGLLNMPNPDGSGRTVGESGLVDPDTPRSSVPHAMAAWAGRNGCEDVPTEEELTGDVTRIRFGCPEGAEVELYRITGGGHTWPGSAFFRLDALTAISGPTTTSIDANEVMWAFFRDR